MINAHTGSVMYVDEARKEEYIEKGHVLVETKAKPIEESPKQAAGKKKSSKK